jgi:RNA polymerase sigma factor FliA
MLAYTQSEVRSAAERERLILEHLPQVHLIASRIHDKLPGHTSLDDLVSTGIIGLIAAVDNFDPAQGVQLKTYAEHKIRGAILDGLRDLDWVPRQKRKKAKEIERAIAALEQRLQRAPEEEEIARALKLSLEEYRENLVQVQGLNMASLEYVGSDGEGRDLLNILPDSDEDLPSRQLERSELQRLLAEAIARLPEVEKTVLALYFQEELTLQEIASILGLHLSRISQLKTQAVLRLRTGMQVLWPQGRG